MYSTFHGEVLRSFRCRTFVRQEVKRENPTVLTGLERGRWGGGEGGLDPPLLPGIEMYLQLFAAAEV